ncbi:MAG: DUF3127 domain-containing protein [Bacteroidales bacterium]|nr:DUF3127 domain-containing protein [Bacteroidales bacterium]MDE7465966.1 DUF3127 domain-containing protein [Muribaculaceae bacterium]
MEIEGKVVADLGMQSGVSKAGNNWKKREIVIETFGQYPRKVKITLFGDRADTVRAEVGNSYAFGIDIESREFNGRWYTDVTAFNSRELGQTTGGMDMNAGAFGQGNFGGAPVPPAGMQSAGTIPPAPGAMGATVDPFAASDSSDDLPF